MAKQITLTEKEKIVLKAVLRPLQQSDYFENATLPNHIKSADEAQKILEDIYKKL